jgi:hypothetical protein
LTNSNWQPRSVGEPRCQLYDDEDRNVLVQADEDDALTLGV